MSPSERLVEPLGRVLETTTMASEDEKMRLRWLSIRGALPLLVLGFFVLLLASGCKQGEGDRCQLDSDCEDGLVCCVDAKDPTGRNQGGICKPAGKCEETPADAGLDGTLDGLSDGELPPDGETLPDTLKSDTVEPDTLKPDTLKPDTLKPDTLQPDLTSVDTFVPDSTSAG
jgi:hypothetical protein